MATITVLPENAPAEITAAEIAPAEVAPAEVTAAEIAPAEIAPAEVTGAESPATPAGRFRGRGRAFLVLALSLALLALSGLAVLGAPTRLAGSPLTAAFALSVVLAVIGTRLLLGRRNRHAETEPVPHTVQDIHIVPARGPESLALRTLRAHVRTLEQALEQEQRHFTPAAADATAAAELRRDVLLTIRALAARTGTDESPRHTLARVAAAVERLGTEEPFGRPVLAPAAVVLPLPRQATVSQPRLTAVAVAANVATNVEMAVETVVEGPVEQPVPAAATEPVPVAASEPATAVSDVVLPVPPLMTSAESQRGRRWFRRQAA